MDKEFLAKLNQSNFDLTLKAYGGLDRIVKICKDNSIIDVNIPQLQKYFYDENFIVSRRNSGYDYTTGLVSGIYADIDAYRFIIACLGQGFLLSPIEQDGLIRHVLDLKGYYNPFYETSYVWNRYHFIYPYLGGVWQTHQFNLKDPRDLNTAHRQVFVGGVVHKKTGISGFSGGGVWARTFLTGTMQTNGDTHMSLYSRTPTSGLFDIDMGYYDNTTSNFELHGLTCGESSSNSAGYYAYQSSKGSFNSVVDSSKYWIGNCRGLMNGTSVYRDGVLFASGGSVGVQSLVNTEYYIGHANSSAYVPSAKEFSYASCGESFSDKEMKNITNSVNAFMTKIGNNV